jgi:hypothetical protein
MAQAFYRSRHQIDHIVARQHGGRTSLDNLALACFPCNNHKGPNLSGIDPDRGEMVRLFHPRRDTWSRHFRWEGARLVGKTAVGRTTIEVLAINHPWAPKDRRPRQPPSFLTWPRHGGASGTRAPADGPKPRNTAEAPEMAAVLARVCSA